jgi:hypothetical protein
MRNCASTVTSCGSTLRSRITSATKRGWWRCEQFRTLLGLPKSTVQDAGVRERKTSKTGHPDEPKPPPPPLPANEPKPLDMTNPSGQHWRKLFDGLRVVNDLPSAEELFNSPHRRLDLAIGPALIEAKARIDEIHRRYSNLQAEMAAAELTAAQADFLDLAGDFSRPIPSSVAMDEASGRVRLHPPR